MSDAGTQNVSSGDRGPPQLPLGTGSTLRGITENYSFHASPEHFIASRVTAFQQSQDPDILNKRTPIRAKILNRNVAVISSYEQIKGVLEHDTAKTEGDNQRPTFVAADAYMQLMDQFFPPPNLLLGDGNEHLHKRKLWETRMGDLQTCPVSNGSAPASGSQWSKQVSEILAYMFNKDSHNRSGADVPFNTPVDLYETMKVFSWRALLKIFLGLSDSPEASSNERDLFVQIQSLHEKLLRGQFSLMPVSVDVGFWKSPRSVGVESRKSLQRLIFARLQEMQSKQSDNRPAFTDTDDRISAEETRDHLLMMTSSLAVKSLTSLLTAFLLNLFLFKHDGVVIADQLRIMLNEGREADYRKYFDGVYLETERLSPPIVGVMRRTTRDVVIQGDGREPDTILPRGWDVWLYSVGAGRDPTVFGENCDFFNAERYMVNAIPEPMGFGTGSKSCLGKHLVRQIVLQVAEHLVTNGISMRGNVSTPGLKAWLGWEKASPTEWAAEIKQLPTQRPKRPVNVEFTKQI